MSYTAEEMRLLCAWCGKEMRAAARQEKTHDGGAPETHGICNECAVQLGLPEDRLAYSAQVR